MSYEYKPVNLSALLEGALAAEMAAETIKDAAPLPVQVAMLTGAIKAVAQLLIDANVDWEAVSVAAARNRIIEAVVENAYS